MSQSDLQTHHVSCYPDGRMDTDNASRYVGLSKKSMAMMRCEGTGPRFVKIASRVFYYRQDLDDWINAGGKCSSTAQARVRA